MNQLSPRVTIATILLLLGGCAAPVWNVDLDPPSQPGPKVVDGRIAPEVTIHNYGRFADPHDLPLTLRPSLAQSLSAWLGQQSASAQVAQVSIEQLDLRNNVGFGTNDDLRCGIESTVTGTNGSKTTVRTRVQDLTNMSSRVVVAGNVILTKCLRQHAQDIAAKAG